MAQYHSSKSHGYLKNQTNPIALQCHLQRWFTGYFISLYLYGKTPNVAVKEWLLKRRVRKMNDSFHLPCKTEIKMSQKLMTASVRSHLINTEIAKYLNKLHPCFIHVHNSRSFLYHWHIFLQSCNKTENSEITSCFQ